MFGVVRDKPIGAARDRGEQHRNIRRMTNQMAPSHHLGFARNGTISGFIKSIKWT